MSTNELTHPESVHANEGAAGAARRATHLSRIGGIAGFFESYAMLLLTVAIAVFFSVWPTTATNFPTMANLQLMLAGQAVTSVIAVAALIPLIANEWDLSIGAIAGMSAVFAASAMSGGTNWILAGLIGVGLAAVIGVSNALLITRFGVNAVITTLGMSVVIEGIVNQKTGGIAVVSNLPRVLTDFGAGTFMRIPKIGYVAGAIAVGAWYLLDHTPYGRYMYAIGSSPEAARLVGLRIRTLIFVAFVVAALLCSLAGLMQIARSGGASPLVGPAFTLPALAAAFLSAAAIKPGRYNVWGTIVALLFLGTLNSGLNLAGAQPYVASYVNGSALIVGVAFAAYSGRRRLARKD